jgi:Ca2+-binding EF-hand superfamily protein
MPFGGTFNVSSLPHASDDHWPWAGSVANDWDFDLNGLIFDNAAPRIRDKSMSTRTTAAQAAHRTTLDAIRFAEVDVNGDGRLDFDEFLALQPSALRKEHTVAEFRSWFAAVDTDSSGTISLTEWFLWVLGKEAARTAHRQKQDPIRAIFAKYDEDSTGFLDAAAFQLACRDLGFMMPAREIFRALDTDQSGKLAYSKIIAQMEALAPRQTEAMDKWIRYIDELRLSANMIAS